MRTIEVERINLTFCSYREAHRQYEYYTSIGCTVRIEGYELVFEAREPVIGRAKVAA